MSILCDNSIRDCINAGKIKVSPPPVEDQYQPASLDLRLDNAWLVDGEELIINDHYILEPGDFVLASTLECVELPRDLVARVEGRSSFGRLGLTVHVTAGFIDPGFKGTITLELANLGNRSIRLCTGERVCQLCFELLDEPCLDPYNGSYQGQIGVTGSKLAGSNIYKHDSVDTDSLFNEWVKNEDVTCNCNEGCNNHCTEEEADGCGWDKKFNISQIETDQDTEYLLGELGLLFDKINKNNTRELNKKFDKLQYSLDELYIRVAELGEQNNDT